jgi:hypothetical protein
LVNDSQTTNWIISRSGWYGGACTERLVIRGSENSSQGFPLPALLKFEVQQRKEGTMEQNLSPEELSERAFIAIISDCNKAIRDGESAVDVWHPDADAVSRVVEHLKKAGWRNATFEPLPNGLENQHGWLIRLGE